MDEPLSNLDAKLRVQMRAELISLHQRARHHHRLRHTRPDRGDDPRRPRRRPQQGRRPAGRHAGAALPAAGEHFVAGFIGSPAMNFLIGHLNQDDLALGNTHVQLPERVRRNLARTSGEVIAGIRPEDFVITANGATSNSFQARIEITEALGPETLVHLRARPRDRPPRRTLRAERGRTEGELSDALVVRFDSNTDVRTGGRTAERQSRPRTALRSGVRNSLLQISRSL